MNRATVQSITVGQLNSKQGKQRWTFALLFKESKKDPSVCLLCLPLCLCFFFHSVALNSNKAFYFSSILLPLAFRSLRFYPLSLEELQPPYLFPFFTPRFSLYALLSSWPPHIFRFNQTCLGASSASHGFWSAWESSWAWIWLSCSVISVSFSLSSALAESCVALCSCPRLLCTSAILTVTALTTFASFTFL